VSVGFQWQSTDATIATGIPPHFTHLAQMQKLFEQQQNLGETILLDNQQMVDKIIVAMDEHVMGNGLSPSQVRVIFNECTTGLKAAIENIGRHDGGNSENRGGSGSDESLLELDRETPYEEQTHFLHICHHWGEAGVKGP
jgi:hypothetical protein